MRLSVAAHPAHLGIYFSNQCVRFLELFRFHSVRHEGFMTCVNRVPQRAMKALVFFGIFASQSVCHEELIAALIRRRYGF